MEVVSAKTWGKAGQLGGVGMTAAPVAWQVGVYPVAWCLSVHHVLGCSLER